MKRTILVLLSMCMIIGLAAGCSQSQEMPEVKPAGMTMLNNVVLDGLGSNEYSGYVGVKIKVGESDLKVTMLGRIGKHMRNDHNLTILDEAKAVVVLAKLTATPDAYYKSVAYVNVETEQPVILSAGSVYYILSQEEKGMDFWYGEKTSTSASPYFTIEGVVMSEDAYDFAFMKDTQNKVLGPVDFAYTIVETEEQ